MKNKALLIALFLFIINASFAQGKLPTGIWRGVITNTSGA